MVEQIRAKVPKGVAGVIDLFHDAHGLLAFVPAVKPGGKIVSPIAQGAEELFAEQPVSAQVVVAAVDRAGELGDLATNGTLTVPVETLPLEDAAEALDRQASRQVRGKLVVVVD